MKRYIQKSAVTLAALAFPMLALADVSGTATLSSGQMLALDTGATVASGGDFQWNGTNIVVQPGVGWFSIPGGSAIYDSLTQSLISSFASTFTSGGTITGVSSSSVIAFKSKGGNFAKVGVNSTSGGSLGLRFTTYG